MSPSLWHYQDGERAAGPVDEQAIRERLRNGRMRAGTLVWCEGMATWAPVEHTLFAADVPLSPSGSSLPSGTATPAAVPSRAAWLVAAMPLGFLVLSAVPGIGLIGLLAYIGLAIYDREQFKQAGRLPSKAYWWMILLGAIGAPVYLYLRARQLGDRWHYTIASVLSLLLFFSAAMLAGTGVPT